MILKFCLASLKGFLPQNFNIIQSSMAHKWLLSLKASDIAEKSTYHKCSELSSIQKQINYIFLLCKRKDYFYDSHLNEQIPTRKPFQPF